MRCETFSLRYDRLEPGRGLDAAMRRHAESCPSCAAAVARAEAACAAYRAGGLAPGRTAAAEERLESRVMAAVRLMPAPRREFSIRDWLIAGAVIAASVILVPFGDYFSRFREAFGASYALPLSLVLGFVLAAYGAIFVGSHLEDVQGFIDRHAPQQR